MKRLGILVVSVALLSGDAALNDARSGEKELSDEIYVYVMDKALKQKVGYSLGLAANVGKTNPYRRAEGEKALAACLVFGSDRVNGIIVEGWWTTFNARLADKARRDAMNNCKSALEKKKGCECFIIDVNDASYVSRSGILNIITGGPTAGSSGRFDGQWEGVMRCGSCENCLGPVKISVSIDVKNSKFDLIPDPNYKGVGVIDDAGNVSIVWRPDTHGHRNQLRKTFRFVGKHEGESFVLSGERGPRSCDITLSRVNSPEG